MLKYNCIVYCAASDVLRPELCELIYRFVLFSYLTSSF